MRLLSSYTRQGAALASAVLDVSIFTQQQYFFVQAEESSSDTTASYSNFRSSRRQLRLGHTQSNEGHGEDRSLFWSNDINVTEAYNMEAAAEECAMLLEISDKNADGVVDWKEYVGFVQLLSMDTPHDVAAWSVTSYFDLPLELQVTYNRLACHFCFANSTMEEEEDSSSTSFRAALAPETLPPSRDECCVGLDTFANSTIAVGINGTEDLGLLEEDELLYLNRMCNSTIEAIEEAWKEGDHDDFTTEGRLTTCPSDFNPGGDCSDYEADLQCEYGHIYTGCTWEELFCQYIERCDCYDNAWSCLSLSIVPCGFDGQRVPGRLPWGQSCDPDVPVPRPPDVIVQGSFMP